jgi:hypothetical protein
MHKSATKCNETVGKWCKNKHGVSKIIDTLETYQYAYVFFFVRYCWKSLLPWALSVLSIWKLLELPKVNSFSYVAYLARFSLLAARDTTSELWTPVQFPLYCYHLFTLFALFTLLAYYYCFPLDMLIPLFIANQWDWQPHRKLGAKYLVVLCTVSTMLLVEDALTRYC